MTEKLAKCPACSGRGYHNCACWPGDCICGYGDETCEECSGDGFIEPGDEQGCYWPEDERPSPAPQPREVGTSPVDKSNNGEN